MTDQMQMQAQIHALIADQATLKTKVAEQDTLIAQHEKRITHVEKEVTSALIKSVQTDVAAGMKSKDVAEKHNVPAMFVSNVAPRKQYAPSTKLH